MAKKKKAGQEAQKKGSISSSYGIRPQQPSLQQEKKGEEEKKDEQKTGGEDAKKESKAPSWEQELEKLGVKLPKETQKKLKEIKAKLDIFKDSILKKFDKYIIAVALLPPPYAQYGQAPGNIPMMPVQGSVPGMPGQQPIMPVQMPQPQQMPPMQMPQVPVGMPAVTQQMQQLQSMQPVPAMAQQQRPVVASSLQQPQLAQPLAQQPQQEQINVLVLVDDSDSRKMPKEELRTKLVTIIQSIAAETDSRMVVQTYILSEIWQNCYDAKYELLQLISTAAPVYDTGMLAAIKIAEIHKTMVLKKFERYIVSYVLAGSLIQGKATEKSDVDVFIVIDDTDVKRMTRAELKDKLRAIIIGMSIEVGDLTGIRNKLNVQVYILTEFWDSIREANPIIFTFLRDGVPFYDRGIFMPWKQLLQMGRIKPSTEAIDMYMSTGDQILKRVAFKLKEIGMEDTFWAILTPSQAALMLYGVPPPTPKETPEVMREIFVKKLGLLEEDYIKILERNIQVRKDLEHGDRKELSGKEVDELMKDADSYLKRINKLFESIQKLKEEEGMIHVYDSVVTMIRDVLKLEGIERVDDLEIVKIFEDELISQGKIPAKFLRILNTIIAAKKDYDEKKLTKAEVEKVKKDSEVFIRFLVEYIQRKRGRELERAKIRVKHGSRFGEVLLLDKEAFIIHDIDHEEKEISKAEINEHGGLSKVRRSSLEELEKALATAVIPPKVFIKEKIFEDLKEVFGKDVEILVNY
ncbi:nucleotidyltransferase domain-containing protein [Candidatus Woesearchaeota archaeon]|nr:nucleotidyltransferase domain-containing protein [Candidatus Woesearchaeota archaeon]